MDAALFCAGLAFDAYVEPPPDSSRWEKGSKSMNVAFISSAFTRNLYKGLLEFRCKQIYDLPDDDDAAEKLVSGDGLDAYLLVAAIEGQWEEDVKMIEKEAYHEGVLGLQGAAHVGRSRTAWARTDERQSKAAKKKKGISSPYHIKSSWTKGGQAIFTEDEPSFFMYIQDPATTRLVFTVMDEDTIGEDGALGSAHRKLTDLIPDAELGSKQLLQRVKDSVLAKVKSGEIKDPENISKEDMPSMAGEWEGEIKLSSKPRIANKNNQVTVGAAAGAMVAGPAGAAAGAFLASMYEGKVRGTIDLKMRYLPMPPVNGKRKRYIVKGGMEGIDWGTMYNINHSKLCVKETDDIENAEGIAGTDLELCFFIDNQETGCSCSAYRSLERKVLVVSFRGTCNPKDLVTDLSLTQEAWVEGEDIEQDEVAKVHSGFRSSLNSISRRLKELLLAVPGPGESINDYSMYVTGHSLGGALATLFTMDIAEFGIDAGRSLPMLKESDAWWKSIASTLNGRNAMSKIEPPPPPRPRSLRMYNFGSPRVGNEAFSSHFAKMQEKGYIDAAYRIVNGDDVVTRMPRSVDALVLGSIAYDHCAATVLVSEQESSDNDSQVTTNPKIWIEGESDDSACPVRDGTRLISPLADGTLLNDIIEKSRESFRSESNNSEIEEEVDYAKSLKSFASKISESASKVSDRLQSVSATDLVGMVGIDQRFAEREMRMIQAFTKGDALANHMEDSYYASMGRACGLVARVGEDIEEVV